jgi:hypothetical protein
MGVAPRVDFGQAPELGERGVNPLPKQPVLSPGSFAFGAK